MKKAKDKILVVELTTAGGMGSGKGRVESISIEGLAMLHALVVDAVDGSFETHALLQEGIGVPASMASVASVHWHRVGAGTSLPGMIKDLAPLVDFCFVVAPEFGEYLEEYTALLESFDCAVLSQPSRAVSLGSDKKGAIERLAAAGVRVPATQSLDGFIAAPALSYPVVVKPNRGAGSIGVFLARDEVELKGAIAANESLSFHRDTLIAQELIVGTAHSASAVATQHGVSLLGINEQDVSLALAGASESKYRGGIAGPLRPELAAECGRVAQAAARLFRLDGYFGFDFVLDPRGRPFLVEINPRLTTSFAGLKMLHPESLLRFIAAQKGGKPAAMPWIPQSDFAAYEIVSLRGSGADLAPERVRSADHQVFWVGMPGGGVSAFIAARGQTRSAAVENLGRLGARLQRYEHQQVDEDRDVMRG